MYTAMVSEARRAEAFRRLPWLLDAWRGVVELMLIPRKEPEILASGVVCFEIQLSSGVEVKTAGVLDYDHQGFPVLVEDTGGRSPDEYEVFYVVDERFLGLVVQALRRAWRDATSGRRAPALDQLHSRRPILDQFLKLKRLGHDERDARSLILDQIAAVQRRWEKAIAAHRAEQARADRPRAAPRPPQYTIFTCRDPYKYRIWFDDRRRQSLEIKLTKREDAICRAVAVRLHGEGGDTTPELSYEDLANCLFPNSTYRALVAVGGKEKVHNLIRQTVHRFNRKFASHAGGDSVILASVGKPGGVWRIWIDKIVNPDDEDD